MKLSHKGAVAAVCMLVLAPLAHGQAAPQRIRGDIAAVATTLDFFPRAAVKRYACTNT